MAVDAYIWFTVPGKVDAVTPKGESQDTEFSTYNAFELKDFSFSVENKSTMGSATGGAGGGRIEFKEFEIKKPTDKASTIFFRNCAAGMHYDVVTVAIRKSGAEATSGGGVGDTKTGKPYLIFHFGTVFTTKIGWSGPGDEGPSESITFAYGQLKIMYYPQLATGSMDTPTITGWSQLKNVNTFTGTANGPYN